MAGGTVGPPSAPRSVSAESDIDSRVPAAIYARVSLADEEDPKKQNPENQLIPLRAHYSKHFRIVAEYVDRESAWRDVDRPAFEKMLQDAETGKFKVVLVWAFDRLQRRGIKATFDLLDRLARCGVIVQSYTEPLEALPPGPMRDFFLAAKAVLAQFESEAISRRTKAGIERRRAAGLPIGRPKGSKNKLPYVRRRRAAPSASRGDIKAVEDYLRSFGKGDLEDLPAL